MVVLSFVRICGKGLECLTVFVMGLYSCFLSQPYHVAQDDLELLIPTVSTSQMLAVEACASILGLVVFGHRLYCHLFSIQAFQTCFLSSSHITINVHICFGILELSWLISTLATVQ